MGEIGHYTSEDYKRLTRDFHLRIKGWKEALAQRRRDAQEGGEEEAYQIGKREGYENALQEIDRRTGGDGEYRWSTDAERHCPDAPAMLDKIVTRFALAASPQPDGDAKASKSGGG